MIVFTCHLKASDWQHFRLKGNIYIDKGMCKGSVALALHWTLEVLGTRCVGKNQA